jgi:hypothetical protein
MSLSGGVLAVREHGQGLRKGGPMNTIRKFILAVVATAVATSFLPTSSFAKKSHKAKVVHRGSGLHEKARQGWLGDRHEMHL